jgi:hypothetical protein
MKTLVQLKIMPAPVALEQIVTTEFLPAPPR